MEVREREKLANKLRYATLSRTWRALQKTRVNTRQPRTLVLGGVLRAVADTTAPALRWPGPTMVIQPTAVVSRRSHGTAPAIYCQPGTGHGRLVEMGVAACKSYRGPSLAFLGALAWPGRLGLRQPQPAAV